MLHSEVVGVLHEPVVGVADCSGVVAGLVVVALKILVATLQYYLLHKTVQKRAPRHM